MIKLSKKPSAFIRFGVVSRRSVKLLFRRAFVRLSVSHLSGPRCFALKDREVALILLGRNIIHSASYIVDYYRSLGVTKIIYMDNGSTDGSEAFFKGIPDTIVCQSLLNFRDWQNEMRHIVAMDFAQGGWRLVVDADELLDFPGSDTMNISDLVSLLEKRGFTGMAAQMLEMVPPGSLKRYENATFAECVRDFTNYSTQDIRKISYHDPSDGHHFFARQNEISNPAICIMYGGLRHAAFGENCLLTKHPLFKPAKGVAPLLHPHFSCGLRLADFTSVLYHYKFAGPFFERERSLEKEGRISHGEGRARISFFLKHGDVNFDFVGLRSMPTIEDLIAQKFLSPP